MKIAIAVTEYVDLNIAILLAQPCGDVPTPFGLLCCGWLGHNY